MTVQIESAGSTRERRRLEILERYGIDTPLKLDLLALLLRESGVEHELAELARQVGKPAPVVRSALEELADRALVVRRRFYNRETFALRSEGAAGALPPPLAELAGTSPAERRRLRCALLGQRRSG
ncbi:MAG: hypothetical protein KatS3mg102_1438 [Planctomycetota bacterium]|nr:MAG: hypothetical protein KatS3mg102_1438 [Planctomycetota bacterium]